MQFHLVKGQISCYNATSKQQCEAIGKCQIVTGGVCSKSMTKPPCTLEFNNGQYRQCCSNNTVNGPPNVEYLGCIPNIYRCLNQCMKYNPTGEVYIVYEGCSFTDANWTDVSTEDSCDECIDDFCSSGTEEVAAFFLVLSIIAFVGAIALGLFLIISFTAFILIRRKRIKEGSVYSEMSLAYLPELSIVQNNEKESKLPPVDENGMVNVRWTDNGLIRIPMSDGSFREVSALKYQRLFEMQQEKRNRNKERPEKLSNSESQTEIKESLIVERNDADGDDSVTD